MQLTFLGAARTVTGSKYLLSHNDKKIMVDCGLFQGEKELRKINWEKLPVNAKNIHSVILTHAHIDHTGYIPILVKNGFKGKIFCSKATFDLCKILLPDSGFLQEEDAMRANKYGYSKHKPALPLYTEAEARKSLEFFEPINFGEAQYFDDDFYFTLSRSGHILGASFVSIFFNNKSLVFSGDLGRFCDPIMNDPSKIQHADYLVVESTYGNRLHDKIDPTSQIAKVINDTVSHGGNVIIPAFAVGRAQNMLYYIHKLREKNEIPDIPVFLDSPMAIDASELLEKYIKEHRLDKENCAKVGKVARYVRSKEESKAINQSKFPMIIISASGMLEGGRILHHLKSYISDHKNTILFTGFQAAHTRGEKILRGEKKIKIHGINYDVKAKIVSLSNSSAHADYEEILRWLGNFREKPRKVFITHGTIESATSLKEKIKDSFGWSNIEIPEYLEMFDLN